MSSSFDDQPTTEQPADVTQSFLPAEYDWTPPSYDVSSPPTQRHTMKDIESAPSSSNFARYAKWSPDGSTALAQYEDASLRYIRIPHSIVTPAPDTDMLPGRSYVFKQAAPILNFAWYPRATCSDPASFCFVTSVRECPVKLLDGTDGRLRASYKIVDHRERQIAPHSLAFDLSATKLYCGFEDTIEVFHLSYPREGTRLHTTPSKKSRDGLKGIISALAFSADASSGVYAAGSLRPSAPTSSNIALFTELTGETPVMYVGDETSGQGFGIRAGVSQLMFNPCRPHLLYAAFRREKPIWCWDIRGDVSRPVQIYNRALSTQEVPTEEPLRRRVQNTNQRLWFDIDMGGNWLGVGDQGGYISMFDLSSTGEAVATAPGSSISSARAPECGPTLRYKAHDDAIGSISFHPLRPLALSVSGSRHFDVSDTSTADDGSSSESDNSDDEGPGTMTSSPLPLDNSAKIWQF